MLVLYTETQLIRAYKVYILEYCTNHYSVPPDLETFRTMFEKFIQNFVVFGHRKIIIASKMEIYINYFADWR